MLFSRKSNTAVDVIDQTQDPSRAAFPETNSSQYHVF